MIDLTELRREVAAIKEAGGGNPRIHPNGFIQLDLEFDDGVNTASWASSHQEGHSGGVRRLHIWNPPGVALPRQDTEHEIHDHVFDMHSTVVKGTLYQQRYVFIIGDDPLPDERMFQLYRAVYSKKSDSRLEGLNVFGRVDMDHRIRVDEGASYTQPASTFHDTETPLGLVVTVMTKTAVKATQAHVLVPKGVEPDNEFDRASAAPSELLWRAIEVSLS